MIAGFRVKMQFLLNSYKYFNIFNVLVFVHLIRFLNFYSYTNKPSSLAEVTFRDSGPYI